MISMEKKLTQEKATVPEIDRSVPNRSISFRIGHWEEAGPSGASRGREPQELLQIGANTNRAQEVQKRHRTVGGIVALQASVAHLLYDSDRNKRKLRDGFALEEGVEEAEDDEKDDGDDGTGLELEEGEVAAGLLEAGLDAVHLLGLGLGLVDGRVGLHGLELLGGLVDGGFERLIGRGPVD